MRALRAWIRRLHLYAGLCSITALVLFGVAGVHATLERAAAPAGKGAVRWVDFQAAPDAPEVEVARAAHARLAIPLSVAPPAWALRHDAAGRLRMTFYTPNGRTQVTVHPERGKLRVVETRLGLGAFLTQMHMIGLNAWRDGRDWRLRLWSLYVEFSVFALLFLATTGLWLALTAPRADRVARGALALGSALLALVWVWIRA